MANSTTIMKVWSWRQAIAKARLESSTKLVLYTLANYMNEHGGGCYPTIIVIAEESGLSDRTVRTHLKMAADAGFIKISKHGFSGQEWANNEYQACYPESIYPGNQTQDIDEKSDQKGAATVTGASLQDKEKAAETIAGASDQGAATDDQKVRQPLPTNSPSISREAPSAGAPARQQESIPTIDAAAAKKIIDDFDLIIGRVFGNIFRRTGDRAVDMQQAKDFLAAGATVEFCRDVFQRKMQQRKNSGGKAPGGLLYFKNIIPEELLMARASGKILSSPVPVPAIDSTITLEQLGGDTPDNRGLMKILDALRARHGDATFNSWFSNLRLRHVNCTTVELTTSGGKFQVATLRDRWMSDITLLAKKVWPQISSVTINSR